MPITYNEKYDIWLRYNKDNSGEQIQELIDDNGRPCFHVQFLGGQHDGQYLGLDVTDIYNQGEDVEIIFKMKRTGSYYSSQMNDTVSIEPDITQISNSDYYSDRDNSTYKSSNTSIGISPINTELLTKVTTTGNISNINYPEVSTDDGSSWTTKTNFGVIGNNLNTSQENRFITIGFGGYSVRQDYYIYEISINGQSIFPVSYNQILFKNNEYYKIENNQIIKMDNQSLTKENLINNWLSINDLTENLLSTIYNNNYNILLQTNPIEELTSSSNVTNDIIYIPNNQLIKMNDYINTQNFQNIDKITLNQSDLNILNNEIKNINDITKFQINEYGIDNNLNLIYTNKENEVELTQLEQDYYMKKYNINDIKQKYSNLIEFSN